MDSDEEVYVTMEASLGYINGNRTFVVGPVLRSELTDSLFPPQELVDEALWNHLEVSPKEVDGKKVHEEPPPRLR